MNYHGSSNHYCEIVTSNGHYMIPHYVLQMVLMGAAVMFAVLVVGFLIILDRARLTNIVRARRLEQEGPTVEETLIRALSQFGQLNDT